MSIKLDPKVLADLDPGIRDVVRYLNDHEFPTTDSGDGVSKPRLTGVLDYPHVAVWAEVYGMVGRARMLLRRLQIGADEGKVPAGFKVQLTYDPEDDSVIIFVSWPAPAGREALK
jgi:hypothetical protein